MPTALSRPRNLAGLFRVLVELAAWKPRKATAVGGRQF